MHSKRGSEPDPCLADDLVRLVRLQRDQLLEYADDGLGSSQAESAAELFAALQALRAQAYELALRVLASPAMAAHFASHGIGNVPRWLTIEHRLDGAAARATVRSAEQLDTALPETRRALASGAIGPGHADAIARAVADYPAGMSPRNRAVAEGKLLAVARTHPPVAVRHESRGVLEESDPEAYDRALGAELERAELRARQDRYLHVRSAGPGRTRVTGVLPSSTAEIVRTALDRLARLGTPEPDRPDVRSAPNPQASDGSPDCEAVAAEPEPDLRTSAQRTADALVLLCERSLAGDPTGGSARGASAVKVVITVDRDQLASGEGSGRFLSSGEQVSIPTVEEFLCTSQIAYAGTGPDAALTDAKRFFTGKLRDVLELRDRGCAFPGCAAPVSRCDGHHIVPYSQGGPTRLDNAVLLCPFHHGTLHHSDWEARIDPLDGLPEFLPPAHLDPDRTPQRHHHLTPVAHRLEPLSLP